MDFVNLRKNMVETQLVYRGIRDRRVLDAFRKVPRHKFVHEDYIYKAYDDMALPIEEGQTISQPYMVALMTELLGLKGDEKVLEVGTGSGYQAAILAELTREVCTVEMHPVLSGRAKEKLDGLGYRNVRYRVGDGTLGWPGEAPFQGIIVTAASPGVPLPLFEQLAEDGVIVIPVGPRDSQRLLRGKKRKGKLVEEYHTYCVFVPLVGEYGWRDL